MIEQDYKWIRKVVVLNSHYPIYDEKDNVIGITNDKDMAIITFADLSGEGNYEMILLTGKYFGYNQLALDKNDMKKVIVINDYDSFKSYII